MKKIGATIIGRPGEKMNLEAPVGLEPTNDGFAIRCLANLATAPQLVRANSVMAAF